MKRVMCIAQIVLTALALALIFKKPPAEEAKHLHNKNIITCPLAPVPRRSRATLLRNPSPQRWILRSRTANCSLLQAAAERERRRIESHLKGLARDVLLYAFLLAIAILKDDPRSQNQNTVFEQLFTQNNQVTYSTCTRSSMC